MAIIHERHDTPLHHLEDLILSRENDTHWQDVWEEAATAFFDEAAAAMKLGWSASLTSAAYETIMSLDMPETTLKACYRVFLVYARTPAAKLSGKALTPAKVKKAALKFAGRDELQDDLADDEVPLDDAVSAVKQALQMECTLRVSKVKDLSAKLLKISPQVPVHVQVEGLRGDCAAANGLYVASGLRLFWGRPLYSQHADAQGCATTTHNVLFFDMNHKTDSNGDAKWTDGMWVLGPTLNSERCTAWFPEIDPKRPLEYPPETDQSADPRGGLRGPSWMVFDTVNAIWKEAPGTHCPGFSVQSADREGQNMQGRAPNGYKLCSK